MVRRDDPWRADDMGKLADDLRWEAKDAKDAPKPVGTFDDDYEALCGIFQVPRHPCLVLRRAQKDSGKTTSVPQASKLPIQFQNFVVDVTTLRITVEALKRSADVDTLSFHNAGLSDSIVGILIEGLPHTTVRCLRLDYNTPLPSSLPKRNEASSWSSEAFPVGEEGKDAGNPAWCSRNFPGLLREGSKLRALQLRGNAIGDAEAVALAEAAETNTVLCTLNLFDNKISDVGAVAFAKSLRLNSVLRGLSLARNRLTSVSAEAFGMLLAGGYEVLPAELEKRAEVESKIAAHNKKAAQDAAKKKSKDANYNKVEARLPLSAVARDADGRDIAGGSKSLAALNLSENRELGAGGALVELLARIAETRKSSDEEGRSSIGDDIPGGAVALRELHLARCRGNVDGDGEEDEKEDAVAVAALKLKPTVVTL